MKNSIFSWSGLLLARKLIISNTPAVKRTYFSLTEFLPRVPRKRDLLISVPNKKQKRKKCGLGTLISNESARKVIKVKKIELIKKKKHWLTKKLWLKTVAIRRKGNSLEIYFSLISALFIKQTMSRHNLAALLAENLWRIAEKVNIVSHESKFNAVIIENFIPITSSTLTLWATRLHSTRISSLCLLKDRFGTLPFNGRKLKSSLLRFHFCSKWKFMFRHFSSDALVKFASCESSRRGPEIFLGCGGFRRPDSRLTRAEWLGGCGDGRRRRRIYRLDLPKNESCSGLKPGINHRGGKTGIIHVSIERELRQMPTISADIYPCLLSVDSGLLMMAGDNRTTKSSKDARWSDLAAHSINDDYLMEPNVNKTFFRTLNHSAIVGQVGSIVQLPCRVHLIADEMVRPRFIGSGLIT